MDANEREEIETRRLEQAGLLELEIDDLNIRRQYATSRLKSAEARVKDAKRTVALIDIALRRKIPSKGKE